MRNAQCPTYAYNTNNTHNILACCCRDRFLLECEREHAQHVISEFIGFQSFLPFPTVDINEDHRFVLLVFM